VASVEGPRMFGSSVGYGRQAIAHIPEGEEDGAHLDETLIV
jgi:hypothetical protein